MPTTRRHAERRSWRRAGERYSLRSLRGLLEVDEVQLAARVDAALTARDATVAQMLARMPAERAQHEARAGFAADVLGLCADALAERDARLLNALNRRGADGFNALGCLGALCPPWLRWEDLPLRAALEQLARGFDATREARSHQLGQRLARQVSLARGRSASGRPARALAHDDASALVCGRHVEALRRGDPVVMDVAGRCGLGAADLRVVEAEMRALLVAHGVSSTSACNTGAVDMTLPLLGGGFGLCGASARLLRLIAGLPAAIDERGWECELRLPPLLQLAAYSADRRSRYTRHLDANPWEVANRREITALFYLNDGWDAEAQGGWLRVHETPATTTAGGAPGGDATRARNATPARIGSGATWDGAVMDLPVDVAPTSGRLVLFRSRTQPHEVLPCEEGERIAITLWIEHAPT